MMNSQNEMRVQLIEEIRYRCEAILHDCDTFLWAKTEAKAIFFKSSTGGGNLLSVLGAISVLVFLGKIYKLYRTPNYYNNCWDEYQKYENIKNEYYKSLNDMKNSNNDVIKKFHSIIDKFSKIQKKFTIDKRYYEFNEKDCFMKLISDSRIGWKELDNEKLGYLYQSYRNNLVHTLEPENIIASISHNNPFNSIIEAQKEILKYNACPFKFIKVDIPNKKIDESKNSEKISKNYSWKIVCYSEILVRDTVIILNWLLDLLKDDDIDFLIIRSIRVFLKNSAYPYSNLHYYEKLLTRKYKT